MYMILVQNATWATLVVIRGGELVVIMICFSAVTHGEDSHHKQHHTRRSHPYLTHTHSHALPHTTRITSRPYISVRPFALPPSENLYRAA